MLRPSHRQDLATAAFCTPPGNGRWRRKRPTRGLPDQRCWRAPLADRLPDGIELSTEQAAIIRYGPPEPIARNTVNLTKIATQWPDMLRVAGSLVIIQVRDYDLLRMLGRDPSTFPGVENVALAPS